ncbi:hypothetical protein [Streptomyces apocyni]|uniref:hypothetical protein n=1 Tax=Streptomyces apocyni TaxID=2654677 RepID=UPI0012EAD8C5|nr:hypothetical protein [Streptomyces apocyni]
MFEIRAICAPDDESRVTTALNQAFSLKSVRAYPTRDRTRLRLYATADHRPEPEQWPTPEEAYAHAPSILSEIGWTTHILASAEYFTELERDYYLRKAAVLDRIALQDENDSDATEAADAAALYLLDTDQPGVICDPRAYVRQQYAAWAASQ